MHGKTKNHYAFVEDEKWDEVSQYKWRVNFKSSKNTFYAQTHIKNELGKWTTLMLHRLVMGVTDPKIQVDHINHNGLVNLNSNLRACSNAENQHNQKTSSANKSGFKGVAWHKLHNKWQAKIRLNKQSIYLGLFTDKIDAALAYNDADLEYFGEFACLNVI